MAIISMQDLEPGDEVFFFWNGGWKRGTILSFEYKYDLYSILNIPWNYRRENLIPCNLSQDRIDFLKIYLKPLQY